MNLLMAGETWYFDKYIDGIKYISAIAAGAIFIAGTIPTEPATARQSGIESVFIDYQRVLQIEGVISALRMEQLTFSGSNIETPDSISGHPWSGLLLGVKSRDTDAETMIAIQNPELRTYWRNSEPGGINNGAVWEGRGVTSLFTAGLFVKYHLLTASIKPNLIYNQNRSFALAPIPVSPEWSSFSNPWYQGRVDYPQRFGNRSFTTFDYGHTYLKLSYEGFVAGISNENRLWGPAMHFPILMSHNAPGFRHFFLGTKRPLDTFLGHIDTTLLWGKLKESDYFDRQSYNDTRYMTGITISISPKSLPDLTLGASRVFFRILPPEGVPFSDLFKVFNSFTKASNVSDNNPGGNDKYGQMFALFGRWVFPRSGFELYGEWARDDHSWNWRDALGEPEHSRAYMAGFQKSFRLSNRNLLAVNAELVQLESSKTWILRNTGSFYTHGKATQGYTHKGQLLGAGTGPGSNSQIIELKYFYQQGRLSAWTRRTVYNNDYFYSSDEIQTLNGNENWPKFWLHNFEYGWGISWTTFINRWEYKVGFEYMREYNDDFIYGNDKDLLSAQVGIRYHISSIR